MPLVDELADELVVLWDPVMAGKLVEMKGDLKDEKKVNTTVDY